MLGEDGRLVPAAWGGCWASLGRARDVRELLKEERRELRLSSLRTPEARRGLGCGYSGELGAMGVADAGEIGVRKLSAGVCLAWLLADDEGAFFKLWFSGSGEGGNAPARSTRELVGWDVRGPPPEVGGLPLLTDDAGDSGGESRGAGMSVPAVNE